MLELYNLSKFHDRNTLQIQVLLNLNKDIINLAHYTGT